MLVEQFINSINQGAVPEIHGAWESVSYQENQRNFEQAVEVKLSISIYSNR